MAKKINTPESKSSPQGKGTIYPWLRLLDLDIQRAERSNAARGRGRPPNPFPRQAVHVTLTREELEALDSIVQTLSGGMKGNIHRGNLIAFMAYRLREQLQKGGAGGLEALDTFTHLADFLDHKGGSPG
jgi:hypothetical protein